MKALLVGFGAFPRAPFNPTSDLVRSLVRRRRVRDLACVATVLPVSYAGIARAVPALIAQHRPDIVLLFGLAARTPYLRIETRARNALSVLLADAQGRRAADPRIEPGGGAERRGRAPFARVLAAVKAKRLPVRLSRDAGRYICNLAYWQALDHDDIGSNRSNVISVIDSNRIERDCREKPVSTFSHPALAEGPALVQFVHVPQIARGPQRTGGRRRLTAADLVRAGEAVLLALAATARTSR